MDAHRSKGIQRVFECFLPYSMVISMNLNQTGREGPGFWSDRLAEKPGELRNEQHTDQGNAATRHELFYPQIGVGKRLDGGRRRVKKYLWSF